MGKCLTKEIGVQGHITTHGSAELWVKSKSHPSIFYRADVRAIITILAFIRRMS